MDKFVKRLLILLVVGCSNAGTKTQDSTSTTDKQKPESEIKLIKYLNNCPTLRLPIKINGSSRSIFSQDGPKVPETDWTHVYAAGQFRKLFETDSMFLMLFYFPAGAGGLTLETLDKDGHIIDSLPVIYKHDNADPSFSAFENATILADRTVITNDTLITYKVDEREIPIPSTKSVKIENNKYRILDNGQIKKLTE
jgi:hypothetical protein